jgi:hypothetical protein
MNFDDVLKAVKAGQVATIQGQIIALTQLQANTTTDYSVQISALQTLITQIQAIQ